MNRGEIIGTKTQDIETKKALREAKELDSIRTFEQAAKNCPMFQAFIELEEAVRDFSKDD